MEKDRLLQKQNEEDDETELTDLKRQTSETLSPESRRKKKRVSWIDTTQGKPLASVEYVDRYDRRNPYLVESSPPIARLNRFFSLRLVMIVGAVLIAICVIVVIVVIVKDSSKM
eukprot:TRINITY_DN4643_c0_g1_i1.p1 TRINITY_DN4643_c0_g1~~TRINITY_DN4643_c0_g1_i1.p1  ORF type:complete len:123 (+),score=25.14 TRINITY_DN4643_c0_g1_i1:30-371(+)